MPNSINLMRMGGAFPADYRIWWSKIKGWSLTSSSYHPPSNISALCWASVCASASFGLRRLVYAACFAMCFALTMCISTISPRSPSRLPVLVFTASCKDSSLPIPIERPAFAPWRFCLVSLCIMTAPTTSPAAPYSPLPPLPSTGPSRRNG